MPPFEVQKYVKVKPFQPFRLYVSDGSEFEINDPSEILISKLSIHVNVEPDESGLFARSILLAPNHVTRLEPIDPSPPVEAGSSS